VSEPTSKKPADAEQAFATRTIHAGQSPDPTTGAIMPPIYATSTFVQQSPGVHKGFDYGRSHNPTRFALERCVADLEGGAQAFAFASGLAAIATVLELVDAGAHIVSGDDVYGGTFRLFERVRKASAGHRFSFVDLTDPVRLKAALTPETKLVWVETPTNPLLGIADLAALAELAHDAGALLVVDNTFATPYLQSPLGLGADVIVHSTTKYCGGHSDVIGGALVVADGVSVPWLGTLDGVEQTGGTELAERIAYHQNAIGAVPGPLDAWLVQRGLKTLAVRMDRHCDNAERVAAFLLEHPRVARVLYPGLPDHPGHAIAARQMRRFGGMISFRVAGGVEGALTVCKRASVFTLAESLGGVESLIEHPGRMTHASVAGSVLEVPEDLIRLSVGLEDAADLIADLDQALP